ncbi:MAG: hypothetical protein LW768_18160 [Rubrivivax sp.]|jgi:hypothetical protein|nr:hypothetical protein [Rubrivivax sp.]
MTSRRKVLRALSGGSAVLGLAAATAATAATEMPSSAAGGARVVTLTFLQAKPGRLAQLERFVRSNWFAMDEIAVQQGLFVSYEWLDTGSDEGPWNAIVMVTYADEKGFDGIQQRWAPIRSAHQEVRPDALGMKDLGQVLETRNLFEREPFTSKRATPSRRG